MDIPFFKILVFPSENNLAFRYAKSSNNLTYERMIIESKKLINIPLKKQNIILILGIIHPLRVN